MFPLGISPGSWNKLPRQSRARGSDIRQRFDQIPVSTTVSCVTEASHLTSLSQFPYLLGTEGDWNGEGKEKREACRRRGRKGGRREGGKEERR